VLDGTELHTSKGAQPPNFRPYLWWPNGWMHQYTLGTEVGLGAGDVVSDGVPAAPPPLKGAHSPNLRPMSVVAKRLDGSRCHFVWR